MSKFFGKKQTRSSSADSADHSSQVVVDATIDPIKHADLRGRSTAIYQCDAAVGADFFSSDAFESIVDLNNSGKRKNADKNPNILPSVANSTNIGTSSGINNGVTIGTSDAINVTTVNNIPPTTSTSGATTVGPSASTSGVRNIHASSGALPIINVDNNIDPNTVVSNTQVIDVNTTDSQQIHGTSAASYLAATTTNIGIHSLPTGLNTSHVYPANTTAYIPSDRLNLNGTHYYNAIEPSSSKNWLKHNTSLTGNTAAINELEVQRISTLIRPIAPLYTGNPREWCYRFRLALSGVSVDFKSLEARIALYSVLALRLPYDMLKNMPRDEINVALEFIENYEVADRNLATVLSEPSGGERPTVLWRKKMASLADAMPDNLDPDLNKMLAWQVVAGTLPVEYISVTSTIDKYPNSKQLETLDKIWQGINNIKLANIQRFNTASVSNNSDAQNTSNTCVDNSPIELKAPSKRSKPQPDTLTELQKTLCNFVKSVQDPKGDKRDNKSSFKQRDSWDNSNYRRAKSVPRERYSRGPINTTDVLNKDGHCWYHEQFGIKARKCRPGCKFVEDDSEKQSSSRLN